MMLSRVYTAHTVVRSVRAMGARRYYANAAPSTQAAPKTPTPQTKAPQGNNSPATPPTSNISKFKSKLKFSKSELAKVRHTLPLRLYSTPGVLASRLFAEANVNKGEVDKVADSIIAIRRELKAHPQLANMVKSPVVSPEQKVVLFNSLGKMLNLHPTFLNFAEELARTKKAKFFAKVVDNFDTLVKARDKIVNVTVTVASKDQPTPSPATVQKVLKYSADTRINLDIVVDPSIEGGAQLKSKDRFYDGSFRREINELKARLAKTDADVAAKKRNEFTAQLAQFQNSVTL